jgi:imidazole glycerol-phosphate synthase subunit HisF
MLSTRVIPCLLLKDGGLVKTVQFRKPYYIGDPINAVKIYNDLEVDELIFLDIMATVKNSKPDFDMIQNIASECFMPFCYGGGIKDLNTIRRLFRIGVEKISLNTAAFENPKLISKSANIYGSQAIVVSMDVKKDFLSRYRVFTKNGKVNTNKNPADFAVEMENRGAGELLINNIDREGTYLGYDYELYKNIADKVKIPCIAIRGASQLKDFANVIQISNVSAVAAGSMFVYQKKGMGVLINYPTKKELSTYLY